MKHHPATVTDNARNARNIVKGVLGFGCNYADGRKNGVRYKWLLDYQSPPIGMLKHTVEDALYHANIKNWKVETHINRYGHPDGISVTIH